MERAIKLLQKVDQNNFMKVFIVVSNPASDIFAIESIAYLTYDEAESFADYKNKKEKTNIYKVFSTCMHV